MIRSFWEYLTEKSTLIMRGRNSDDIHWRLNITPLGLWGSVAGLILILFALVITLCAYTSILDILPGYRTKAERLGEQLTESIMRLDLMERNMEEILAYNEAVATIMGGSTPALHSTVLTDTIRYDKSRILPTRADSLLRSALESTTNEYSLTNTKPLQGQAAMFSTPMRGNITRNFDAPESSYDVAIMSIDGDDSVMAVENGTIIAVENQAEGLYSVTIQHNGGYISVYKLLGEILVRKGQTVQSGSVIGSLKRDDDKTEQNVELGFELWRDGTAVDPERYILF
ncbi:MAG: M23 family metallopeptidase [Alistipes sp.]|nr:M23 family metallopeptidase [Alistipes sp.]